MRKCPESAPKPSQNGSGGPEGTMPLSPGGKVLYRDAGTGRSGFFAYQRTKTRMFPSQDAPVLMLIGIVR